MDRAPRKKEVFQYIMEMVRGVVWGMMDLAVGYLECLLRNRLRRCQSPDNCRVLFDTGWDILGVEGIM
jgi:hypothetical protein